jgi:hypothetical protein
MTVFADPAACRFYQNENGHLCLAYQGFDGRVQPMRLRPFNEPARYICLADEERNEVAILDDLASLDEASQTLVSKALAARYFCPVITKIFSVKEKRGIFYFHMALSGTQKRIAIKNPAQYVAHLPGGAVLLTDTDGNRYRIPDLASFDRRSAKRAGPYLY